MLAALVVGLLVVIAMPALLRTSPRADNIDAQANLRNALIEAKSAYYPTQSYSFRGLPLSPLSFAACRALHSRGRTGPCSSAGPDCVSEQVVDVDMAGDSQGVVLATWSSITRTCWFAVDLESVPKALFDDRAGVAFLQVARSAPSVSGTYFARSAVGAASCSASSAVGGSGHSDWSHDLDSVGTSAEAGIQSGPVSCLRPRRSSRRLARSAMASWTTLRVSAGSMTASTYPLSAAIHGVRNVSA